MNDFKQSRDNYISYKFLGKSIILADDMVDVEVLSILDRLGFPMYDKWTYIYKDLILVVANRLKMVDKYGDNSCLELISWLSCSDSLIYREFALDLGISLDELNLSINGVISRIDEEKMDESLLREVCEEYSYELNYGELAFVLASMILGFKKKNKSKLVKIRSL